MANGRENQINAYPKLQLISKYLFWYISSSLPKNEWKGWLYYNGTWSRNVSIRFMGELKALKRYFEINWSLDSTFLNIKVFIVFIRGKTAKKLNIQKKRKKKPHACKWPQLWVRHTYKMWWWCIEQLLGIFEFLRLHNGLQKLFCRIQIQANYL